MASSSSVQIKDLSFVAKVELIQLTNPVDRAGDGTASEWKPPVIATAFTLRHDERRLFKWKGGNMHAFDGQCPGNNQRYSAATIFNQGQSKQLLSVLCDAADAGASIAGSAGGWRSLKFEAGKGSAAPTLSHVGPEFKYERLRGPGGQPCVKQLLPARYHHQQNPTAEPAITGLIGKLPILIALGALSTSETKIKEVLQASIKEHKWKPHEYEQDRLRDKIDIGVVVTIYYDSTNHRGSTKELLKKLEEGGFGAFYRT